MTNGELDLVSKSEKERAREQAARDGPVIAARKARATMDRIDAEERLAEALRVQLRQLWGYDHEERAAVASRLKANPLLALYLRLAKICEEIAEHRYFVNFVTFWIIVAGTLVGVQTELAKPGRVVEPPAIYYIDWMVLSAFTLDCILKIIAEGEHPLHYFVDAWYGFTLLPFPCCRYHVLQY